MLQDQTITQDLHIHTTLSSCANQTAATVENYIKAAKVLDMDTIGFANHLWDSDIPGGSPWYAPQDFAHLLQILPEVSAVRAPRILIGAETEFDRNGTLGITQEHAQKLDYLLVPHSHTHMIDFVMPRAYSQTHEKHAQFLRESFMRLIAHPLAAAYITAVAHPFCPVGLDDEQDAILRCISDAQFQECFVAAKEMNIALEINAGNFEKKSKTQVEESEFIRMYTIAREVGCKFTYGSDAHNPRGLRFLPFAYLIMEKADIHRDQMLLL